MPNLVLNSQAPEVEKLQDELRRLHSGQVLRNDAN